MAEVKINFTPILKLKRTTGSGFEFEVDKDFPTKKGKFNGNCPGVYVWGFKYNKRFIPYYVGEATISVFERIKQHKSDIQAKNSTYIRLEKDYMTGDKIPPYWYDPEFPKVIERKKGVKPLWCRKNEDKVAFWSKKDENKVLSDYNREEIDVLCSKVQDNSGDFILKENFRLFYWNLIDKNAMLVGELWEKNNDLKIQGRQRELLEIFEAFIKFSLKGKTVSESISIPIMKKRIEMSFPDTEFKISRTSPNSNYFIPESSSDSIEYHNDRDDFKKNPLEDPYLT